MVVLQQDMKNGACHWKRVISEQLTPHSLQGSIIADVLSMHGWIVQKIASCMWQKPVTNGEVEIRILVRPFKSRLGKPKVWLAVTQNSPYQGKITL